MILKAVRAFAAFCLLASCTAQEREPGESLEADLTAIGEEMIERPLLRSASIAVVHKGESAIVHVGELEDGTGNAPTDRTLYEIGSVSKTFAGALMARAVLDGKVALDEPVQTYLGDRYGNLAHDGEPVRIRHLLTHTAGLPNMLPEQANTVLDDFVDHSVPARLDALYRNYGQAEFLRDMRGLEIESRPGQDRFYSSAGTELVAHILETIYGQPFETLLQEHFSSQTGMKDLYIRLPAAEAGRLAPGYHADNPVPTTPMPLLPWGAAGAIKTTVPDMVRYMQYQLAAGALVAESHRQLARSDATSGSGYFWNIDSGDAEYGTYYSHHGGVPRSQCYLFIFPERDLAVFVITNQSGENTPEALEWAVEQVADVVMARDGTPRVDTTG